MKRSFRFLITVAVANLLCVFVIAPGQSAQQKDEWKSEIDDFVRRADETFDRSKRTHTVNLIRKNKKFLIEESNFKMRKGERLTRTFSYSVNAREIERLTVYYKTGKVAAEENYYFQNKKLVYATEEHFFKTGGEINSVWSGHFYFRDGELLDHRTNGHGKSETDEWTPETELLQMSRARLRQLTGISGRCWLRPSRDHIDGRLGLSVCGRSISPSGLSNIDRCENSSPS